MGPLEVLSIVGAVWLFLSVLVVLRFGWLVGVILAFSLVPMASGAIFYVVLGLGIALSSVFKGH